MCSLLLYLLTLTKRTKTLCQEWNGRAYFCSYIYPGWQLCGIISSPDCNGWFFYGHDTACRIKIYFPACNVCEKEQQKERQEISDYFILISCILFILAGAMAMAQFVNKVSTKIMNGTLGIGLSALAIAMMVIKFL